MDQEVQGGLGVSQRYKSLILSSALERSNSTPLPTLIITGITPNPKPFSLIACPSSSSACPNLLPTSLSTALTTILLVSATLFIDSSTSLSSLCILAASCRTTSTSASGCSRRFNLLVNCSWVCSRVRMRRESRVRWDWGSKGYWVGGYSGGRLNRDGFGTEFVRVLNDEHDFREDLYEAEGIGILHDQISRRFWKVTERCNTGGLNLFVIIINLDSLFTNIKVSNKTNEVLIYSILYFMFAENLQHLFKPQRGG